MFKRVMLFVGHALIFRKGHRRAGLILWMIIIGIASAIENFATAGSRERYAASIDYRAMCASGEFEKAHLVKAKYYDEYSAELGSWRSGAWRDREAREAQERYHAVAAYIFGQEIVSLHNGNSAGKNQLIIGLLVAIPVEGAPLAEGEYGSGMFYNNDASISSPTSIDHVVYQSWVTFYNSCCDKVLDLALAKGDMELADMAYKLYKREVSTHYTADEAKGGNYNIATVGYNDLRKDIARQKIMESTNN